MYRFVGADRGCVDSGRRPRLRSRACSRMIHRSALRKAGLSAASRCSVVLAVDSVFGVPERRDWTTRTRASTSTDRLLRRRPTPAPATSCRRRVRPAGRDPQHHLDPPGTAHRRQYLTVLTELNTETAIADSTYRTAVPGQSDGLSWRWLSSCGDRPCLAQQVSAAVKGTRSPLGYAGPRIVGVERRYRSSTLAIRDRRTKDE